MRFSYRLIHGLTDVQRNFEQIETAFGYPVYPAPPSDPQPGQAYFDSTLDAASSPALGYWGPVRGWTYV